MYIQELKRRMKAKKRQKVVNLVLIVVNLALYALMAVILTHPTNISERIINAPRPVSIQPQVKLIRLTTQHPELEAQIREIADEEGYKDIDGLLFLIQCESQFRPYAVNVWANHPRGSYDRGLMQFSSYWQAKVSDDCAFSVDCSVRTAISMLKKGQGSLWACSKIINKIK